VHLARPKHLGLSTPRIETDVTALDDGRYAVTLRTDKPALWSWLQLGDHDATYSDNFVHLRPGAQKQIIVSPAQAMREDEFKSALTVSSLRDTYA